MGDAQELTDQTRTCRKVVKNDGDNIVMALSGYKFRAAEPVKTAEDEGVEVGKSWTAVMSFVVTDETKMDDR